MNKPRIADVLKIPQWGRIIVVNGWVRTRRDSGNLSFIELGDGSSLANLQVIAEPALPNYSTEIKKLTAGCAIEVKGRLVASPAKGQDVELPADSIEVIGWADPASYPLQKKRHSFEFLRSITHLRPRTNALAAVGRVRSALSFGIHEFFVQRGFYQVHTPVITTSDCEGAGEMFTVTALEPEQLQGEAPYARRFFWPSRRSDRQWSVTG